MTVVNYLVIGFRVIMLRNDLLFFVPSSLVVKPPVFTTILLLTTSAICPDLQRIVIFAPLCQSNHTASIPSQNAAFYALLQQFEKGFLYDKSNVHLPRQYLQKLYEKKMYSLL